MRDAINVLLHHVARWQIERDGGSLLLSLCYSLFQVSFGTMHRADGNAGLSRYRAHAHASRQQWRNFGTSAIFRVARSARSELCAGSAHK